MADSFSNRSEPPKQPSRTVVSCLLPCSQFSPQPVLIGRADSGLATCPGLVQTYFTLSVVSGHRVQTPSRHEPAKQLLVGCVQSANVHVKA
jgi:hypothetical protein